MTTIGTVIPFTPKEKSTVGIDAERLRAYIAKLTSSSINELEKLIAELEALQEFLKCKARRVQSDIESVPFTRGKQLASLTNKTIVAQMDA